jgi:hypothetical protein
MLLVHPFKTTYLFVWGEYEIWVLHNKTSSNISKLSHISLLSIPLPVCVVMLCISGQPPADRRHGNGALFGAVVRGGRLLDRIFTVLRNVWRVWREADTESLTLYGHAFTSAKQMPCISTQFFRSKDHRIAHAYLFNKIMIFFRFTNFWDSNFILINSLLFFLSFYPSFFSVSLFFFLIFHSSLLVISCPRLFTLIFFSHRRTEV